MFPDGPPCRGSSSTQVPPTRRTFSANASAGGVHKGSWKLEVCGVQMENGRGAGWCWTRWRLQTRWGSSNARPSVRAGQRRDESTGASGRRKPWQGGKRWLLSRNARFVDEVARQAFWPKGISGEQQRSSPVFPHLHPTRRFTLLHHGRAPPASPQSVYASIRASSAPRQWDPLKTPIAPHTTPSPPPCVPSDHLHHHVAPALPLQRPGHPRPRHRRWLAHTHQVLRQPTPALGRARRLPRPNSV
jgi:hypothetical protein